MARTEKKFGQVNQAALGSPAELVPTSSNRRNVLLNFNARSTATVTAFTTTGNPAPATFGSLSAVGSATAISGIATTSNAGFALNVAKTRGVHMATGTVNATIGYNTISATTSGLTVSGSNSAVNTNAVSNSIITNNVLNPSLGGNNFNSAPIKFIDDQYFMIFSQVTGSGATTAAANRYGLMQYTGAAAPSAVGTNYTTPSGVADSTMQRSAAIALQYPTATTGVGYILAMHATAATVTNAVELMGMYIYSSGAESGRVWWNGDGTALKSAGRAAQFFSCGDYNKVNGAFAFPHTTDGANLWLNATATGGSGSVATNLPKIPAGASSAGFRLVADDGTFGTARKYLDGTVSYPAAPTGVTLPTASDTIPQVQALKFSPNGAYLAVMYYRGSTQITTTANSAVVIYTRQGNGTYTHTHSSGSAIAYSGIGADAMTWSADSSTIYVLVDYSVLPTNQHTVYAWNPFAGTSSINNATANAVSVAYTAYPNVPSYTAPSSGTSTLVTTASVTSGVFLTSNTSTAASIYHLPVSGYPGLVVGCQHAAGSQFPAVFNPTTLLTVGTATTAPNYVNTITQSIPLASGTTVQLSGAVLESGERIYIEPNTGSGVVDAVAYGVEIS